MVKWSSFFRFVVANYLVALASGKPNTTATGAVLIDISNAAFEVSDTARGTVTGGGLVQFMHHIIKQIQTRSGLSQWGGTLTEDGDDSLCTTLQLDQSGGRPGWFTVTVHQEPKQLVKIVASDTTGFRAALGRLARELRASTGRVLIPEGLDIRSEPPLWPLRGHQYTAAHHPSMFKTWAEFDST
jgi:hypothetical protein